MTLKEKMKRGPVFGMACFTGTTCVIENIAMSGLDFIYLDLEHTNWMLNEEFEKQIMAARLHDISVLVRMADDDEVAIRKVLEWGADGVVIPHCKTAEMTKRCVQAAKFSPMGRRGGESNVRAAGFGYHNFDWNSYMEQQNRDTLVIPMDEDYEFTDNIDEILAVEGVDAVNFGPIDYAVSKNLKVGYSMGDEVKEAFQVLVKKAKEKGIGVLGPVVPPTRENIENAIASVSYKSGGVTYKREYLASYPDDVIANYPEMLLASKLGLFPQAWVLCKNYACPKEQEAREIYLNADYFIKSFFTEYIVCKKVGKKEFLSLWLYVHFTKAVRLWKVIRGMKIKRLSQI